MKSNSKLFLTNALRGAALGLLGFTLASCASTKRRVEPPATAKAVELARYSGRWFEIARLPMFFQKANESAVAEYGINPDGTVSVHNIATRPNGTQHGIRGYAKVVNPPENSKLAVHFNAWFSPLMRVPKEGNYWILYVDEVYQEAIVGTPNRKSLWLLARTPTISEERYAALIARAQALGFDTSRMIKDPQPANGFQPDK